MPIINLKVCVLCKSSRPITEFNKKGNGLQPQCRECGKQKSKEYYSSNKEHHKKVTMARHKKQVNALLQYSYDFLHKNGCVECGENDPCCLDFDHLRDKKMCVSIMIGHGCSLQTLLEEIEKCEIRCANCHRRKTARDQNWYRNINTGS